MCYPQLLLRARQTPDNCKLRFGRRDDLSDMVVSNRDLWARAFPRPAPLKKAHSDNGTAARKRISMVKPVPTLMALQDFFQGLVYFCSAIVVANESSLPEPIHEQIDSLAGRADHLRQNLVT